MRRTFGNGVGSGGGGGGGPPLSNAAPLTLNLTPLPGVSPDASRADHQHAHGNLAETGMHANAGLLESGFMSPGQVQTLNDLTVRGGPFCWGADQLADITGANPQWVRLGSGLLTIFPAIPGNFSAGLRCADFTHLLKMTVSHTGSAFNLAGQLVIYDLLLNGVPVPGASVTLGANNPGALVASAAFDVFASPGDLLQMRAANTLLGVTVTDIQITVQG